MFIVISMGTITVNVSDEVEEKFREVVWTVYGKGKGRLGKALEESIGLWIKKEQNKDVVKAMELLKTGLNLGKLTYKKRDELYDR